MSGSIQSDNYVPGASGWKLNSITGEFEINSCTLGSAAKAPERQMVSVEVASYSKYDLPKNAANLVQFMEAELQKVPEQYRHAAEFEEFDASYGDESFNARLFLSYSRLETEEELADRLEKAEVSGASFSVKNGVAYINEAFIKDGMIDAKIATNWSVRMGLQNGRYVATGVGLGLESQLLVSTDRFAIKDGLRPNDSGDALAMAIKGVICAELKPGGLLHRSR